MDLKFKILNKSKAGIVIDFKKKGKLQLSWENFNKKYVIVDGYAEFNEQEKLRIELAHKARIEESKAQNLAYSTGKHKITLMSAKGYDQFFKKFIK